jgi:hypothetical protein
MNELPQMKCSTVRINTVARTVENEAPVEVMNSMWPRRHTASRWLIEKDAGWSTHEASQPTRSSSPT